MTSRTTHTYRKCGSVSFLTFSLVIYYSVPGRHKFTHLLYLSFPRPLECQTIISYTILITQRYEYGVLILIPLNTNFSHSEQ